ncbi:hypothetical protein HOLleu_39493 [Holothuria leucospilota]|uniref:Ig-like domain-containing protein n=1 Tax=Holothuria leucospilota TaxID=206669 RepID=A0A9Q1BE51_HOLLE|nr:hypothetical protein HOLleu_39493 [Holothuria leucospilota]
MSFSVFVISFVTVIPYSAVAAYVQIFFNSTCFDSGYCYVFEGDTIALTCTIPTGRGPIGIITIKPEPSGWDFNILVKSGQLQEAEDISSKFMFESSQGNNTLIIRNLMESDNLFYRCWYYFVYTCSLFEQVYFRCWKRVRGTVYLDVRKKSNTPMGIDFCNLIGGMSGVFFIREDLILECPTANLSISISNSTYTVNVEYKSRTFNQNSFLLSLEVSEKFNGTTMSCMRKPNIDNTDYCRQFPKLSVFNGIKVTTTPEKVVVENGGNATIFCHSIPFLEDVDTSFEWDFLENNVIFGNIEESETSTGTQISIDNIDFTNTITTSFDIICRVTIGSRNSSAFVTVTLSSTTDVQMSSSTISSKETSPAAIVVPLVVTLLILAIVVVGIIYIKVIKGKNTNEKNRGEKEDSPKQNETVIVNNLYDIKDDATKAKLGLTKNDSEVADNVAYVSYGEGDE